MSDVHRPGWYRDAIIYEVHVRSFFDNKGDGVGDFNGLTAKLDYLQDLGVTALWLLPFYPSPLRDEGYDIADYKAVNPIYGDLHDFKTFLAEANRRGLNVITELVVNHTSDQHPWFQRARRAAPGSSDRNFYVWSDTPDKYKEARIIFKDFEKSNWTKDEVAGAYYWHRFYAHQPDLNFENPAVKKAVFDAMNFWLKMGVSGLRLDAVPYLYEKEGTNCENLPQTHAFLRDLRRHVDAHFKGRMLLAEANQWPEDAAAYFGAGDECHVNFHFPLMPRLFMAIRLEDSFPIQDILEQTPTIPEGCQWAVFLRNHDELTLEMVTEEERDYMWRIYAQDPKARLNLGIRRRLAPLMNNDRRKIELMNVLLFSMPGTPVLYYGDEIGMGDNYLLHDRNGVRTPMQWDASLNAGFSSAPAERLYLPVITESEYHYQSVNVAAQQANPDSLLHWVKRLIAVRKGSKALGRGAPEFLETGNRKVLAFLSRSEGESVLVVGNLSRASQQVSLSDSRLRGGSLVDLLSGTRFTTHSSGTLSLTLAPYGYFLLSLKPKALERIRFSDTPAAQATLTISKSWRDVFAPGNRAVLADALTGFIERQRWFGGKARVVQAAQVEDVIAVDDGSAIVIIGMKYVQGESERYQVPVAFDSGATARAIVRDALQSVVAWVKGSGSKAEGVLYDALLKGGFAKRLVVAIDVGESFAAERGDIGCIAEGQFATALGAPDTLPQPTLALGEQSNTSVFFGKRAVLKLFRRLEPGVNPDLEIGRFLAERTTFDAVPRLAGAVEYRREGQESTTLAIIHGFVGNKGDAWKFTQDAIEEFHRRVLEGGTSSAPSALSSGRLLAFARRSSPAALAKYAGGYLSAVSQLGRRTGELHLALASEPSLAAFTPEPFGTIYQQSLYQSMRGGGLQTLALLRGRIGTLPRAVQRQAKALLEMEDALLARFEMVTKLEDGGMRIRVHGDYHLGQVLWTGDDFVVIDFEGEPARAIGWRRLKRSPLKDVAGMLRSLDYAATVSSRQLPKAQASRLQGWTKAWRFWAQATFLDAYLKAMKGSGLLPQSEREMAVLLEALLLEKALYEIEYELNNRPDWVEVPLAGALHLLTGGA